MAESLTADEFMTGLLAGLAVRGRRVVPVGGTQFDRAVARVFAGLKEMPEAAGIVPDFEILTSPMHGDSATVRDAISVAVQGRIASLDNPKYQHLRIKLDADRAERLLNRLPGGRDLFMKVTDDFLDSYESVAQPTGTGPT